MKKSFRGIVVLLVVAGLTAGCAGAAAPAAAPAAVPGVVTAGKAVIEIGTVSIPVAVLMAIAGLLGGDTPPPSPCDQADGAFNLFKTTSSVTPAETGDYMLSKGYRLTVQPGSTVYLGQTSWGAHNWVPYTDVLAKIIACPEKFDVTDLGGGVYKILKK